eukprot:SAG22_NODE_509_length_9598_cov_12.010001_5_plen_80_part_00
MQTMDHPHIVNVLMDDALNEALTKLHRITLRGGHEQVREQDVFDKPRAKSTQKTFKPKQPAAASGGRRRRKSVRKQRRK